MWKDGEMGIWGYGGIGWSEEDCRYLMIYAIYGTRLIGVMRLEDR